MASRAFRYPQALKNGVVILAGNFTTDASGNITAQTFQGGTVTKTGTGAYRLTLQDRYVGLLSCALNMQQATVSAYEVQPASTTDVTAATPIVDIITKNAGAAANVASISTVYINLTLNNSSV